MTGVTMFTGQLLTKRLQLLHELIPSAASVAALMNPHNPASQSYTEELKAAGSSLGLKLQILMAGSERDLEDVFETLREHTAPMPFS